MNLTTIFISRENVVRLRVGGKKFEEKKGLSLNVP